MLTVVRAPRRLWHALLFSCGKGAYGPYAIDEVPIGEVVRCTQKPNLPCVRVIGKSMRGNLLAMLPGGNICSIHLSNGSRVNAVAYYRNYRYADGTICGRYIPGAKQTNVDLAADKLMQRMGNG